MVAKKQIKADRSRDWKVYSTTQHGVPEQYNKFHRQKMQFNLDSTSKYSLRQVPSYIVQEFEYIINAYLTFCQREKMRKLKKLRKSQSELPIAERREDIIESLKSNNVLVIAGDTGCGKSTQVPQYLLQAGYESVACTQPRRIACISLAKRVSYETLGEFGSKIAYAIRFEKTRTSQTKMLFLTEGLLLRQMSLDPQLSAYNVLILDEIHERHIHGDFLMGMLRQLVKERTDLKLILMSATINIDLFSGYFEKAPVIQVPGRLYPIQLQYFPIAARDKTIAGKEAKSEKIDPAPYKRILQLVDSKFPSSERGDLLVFLSGISEITTVAEALKVYAEQSSKWIILMLHSTLSLEEQDKVFDIAPEGVRKCILSTNIAETSVTIDGVRFVLDSGKVKEMRYDSSTRMHQLKEIWVSKASANQRKGRAGRTGPGVCYRLYSADDFDKLVDFSTSEIHRVSLESLVLQMYQLELPDPRHFAFIEPPPMQSLQEAVEGLKDQGALRANSNRGGDACELTPLGQILTNLPVDVSIGKMLVMGCLFKQVEAVLTVAAGLSVQNLFTNRSYRDLDCTTLRRNLMSDHGDPFTLLLTYREWLKVKAENSDASRVWCRKRGIEEQRLYEITKLRRQFKDLLEDSDLIEKQSIHDQATFGSADRRIRAGELKQLRDLKKKMRNDQRKRKVLKADEHFDTIASKAELDDNTMDSETMAERQEKAGDIHAVEFQMRHSSRELDSALKSHKLNHDMATILKLILASALYPQYGILDQYNSYKSGSDSMVHTKVKPFLVLHPNSSIAQDPECLQITSDKEGKSENHQAIFYGLLLETTKAYIVNSLRLQALHNLLLFARQVDTSPDFTRVICDEFVEFVIPDKERGEEIISSAASLRKLMYRCLERKLEGDTYRSDRLARKLMDYFEKPINYSLKKIANSDKTMFFSSSDGAMDTDPKEETPVESSDSKKFKRKREHDIGQFLTVGSIPSAGQGVGTTSQYLSVKWECPKCHEEFYSNSVEKLNHISNCREEETEHGIAETQNEAADGTGLAPPTPQNPLLKSYFCSHCSKTLELTPVEILKHKRSHVK